ncbi:MAG TPA: ATP-binding cassette domain-containing protein [Planctomycetaceae bacterium]|nr:ATP-binding cassette domain-containing protein [Planctomycetaceae bacterium]
MNPSPGTSDGGHGVMNERLWHLEEVRVEGWARSRLDIAALDIPRGITAVLGISGAGKTTLLNLLCGFTRPDRGRVDCFLARNNCRLPLFWVPQNDGLWPHRTARAHLEHVKNGEARPARDWLADFNLSDHAEKTPEQLSHGERNRLAIARALASGASVLVLDEPMAHVDPAQIGDYWKVIRDRSRESGISLIIATHSPEVALSEAEHAICLRDGRVIYSGPMHDLYHSPCSPEEAALLGPANWLSPAESRQWLGTTEERDRCYRPEQIVVSASPDGPFTIEETRFAGSFGEVAISDPRTATSRRFFHRPSGPGLSTGQRVALKLIVALCMCFFASACDKKDQPALKVREIHYWTVPPQGSRFPAPRSVTCGPNHENYVLDRGGRVLVYGESGALLRKWDMPDARNGNPEGACVFLDGRIAVADTHYSRVVFFNHDGKVVGMLGSAGQAPSQFVFPVCVTQDPHGNFYVGEYGGNDRVQKFAVDGKFLLQIGRCGTAPGEFERASGVVWRDGLLYIADSFNNRIQVFTDAGEFRAVFGSPDQSVELGYPYALALGPQNDLFVIEYSTARVSRFDLKTGRLLGRFGSPGRGEGQFATPWGLDVDSKGTILVADTDNRRIVELLR